MPILALMRPMGGAQVREAVEHALAVLDTAADRDWAGTRAGGLEWDCLHTAEHIASDLIAYAGQLAGRAREGYVPFEATLEDDAGPAGARHVIRTTGALLAATVDTTPPGVRAFHPYPFREADREGFAAMGVAETVLHTHDIAQGLGLPYEPPAALCEGVLTRIFPHVRPAADPWPTLLWATGRGDLPGRDPVTGWRWNNPLFIDAERLTLHGLTPAAAADLAVGGTGGFDWVEGGPYEGTRDAAGMVVKAYEAGVLNPEWGTFVQVRAEDGRAVGAIGFHGPPGEDGRAEVGYDLAEAARGHGYATEAVGALARWARGRDDVRALFATVDPDNAPSQAVVTRAGFTRIADEGDLFAYELPLRD